MRFILLLLLLASCAGGPLVKEKIIFVDMKTYQEWGTTKLVPISRRALPTEDEICHNPLWINTKQCRQYLSK